MGGGGWEGGIVQRMIKCDYYIMSCQLSYIKFGDHLIVGYTQSRLALQLTCTQNRLTKFIECSFSMQKQR